MNYYFSGFSFNSVDETLHQGDQIVQLGSKSRALLALFLNSPQRILRPEEILEKVWAGPDKSFKCPVENCFLFCYGSFSSENSRNGTFYSDFFSVTQENFRSEKG